MLLQSNVPLQKQVDEVVPKVVRLAQLPVALQDLDDGFREPVPRSGILDEIVDHLVQGLPASPFHPLFQPAPGLKREASADAGEFDRSRGACHEEKLTRSGTKNEAQMRILWTQLPR